MIAKKNMRSMSWARKETRLPARCTRGQGVSPDILSVERGMALRKLGRKLAPHMANTHVERGAYVSIEGK